MGIWDEMEKTTERMRKELYELIRNKENLLDSDVINASQRLDSALNEYNEIDKK